MIEDVKKDHFISSFLDSLYIEKGLSQNTVSSYKNDITSFVAWLNKKNIDDKMFISMIEKSLDDPSTFKMKNNKTNIPDGSPIGSFLCY